MSLSINREKKRVRSVITVKNKKKINATLSGAMSQASQRANEKWREKKKKL